MRHPAIKRSAFAVVACERFGLCRTITGCGSLLAKRRSRTHGIHEHGTSRIRASRRIAASFHRESRDLDEYKGELRTFAGLGIAETMRSSAWTMARENEGARISRHAQ